MRSRVKGVNVAPTRAARRRFEATGPTQFLTLKQHIRRASSRRSVSTPRLLLRTLLSFMHFPSGCFAMFLLLGVLTNILHLHANVVPSPGEPGVRARKRKFRDMSRVETKGLS